MNWKVYVILALWALAGIFRFVNMGVDGLCSFPFALTSVFAVLSFVLDYFEVSWFRAAFIFFILCAIVTCTDYEEAWPW